MINKLFLEGCTISVYTFIKEDNFKGLFPLLSNEFLPAIGERALIKYINTVLSDEKKAFKGSVIAYALKDKLHTRKTLILDPITTYFIYDFVNRNRSFFQNPKIGQRRFYGYGYDHTTRVKSFKDYHRFRQAKYLLKTQYKYFVKLDINDCFNSFYHHEIIYFLRDLISESESMAFDKYLNNINNGDSINCFPQGIYPAKVIGNHYLRFIEDFGELQCEAIIRFLDDIILFSNNINKLEQDVLNLQKILGDNFLSLNSSKTQFGSKDSDLDIIKIDEIKKTLLEKRQHTNNDYDDDEDIKLELEEEEIDYIESILNEKNVPEQDVELALSLMVNDIKPNVMERLLFLVIDSYPQLIKHLYNILKNIDDEEILSIIYDGIISFLKKNRVHEFELFWLQRILIDYYENDENADLLLKLYKHPSSTIICKAALLEISENSHGLAEMKENHLRDFPDGISAICSVVGLRSLEKSKRNRILKRAASAEIMSIICNIVSSH